MYNYDCPACPDHPLPCPCYANCNFRGMAETQIIGLRNSIGLNTDIGNLEPGLI